MNASMQHGAQTEEVLALAVEVLRVLADATRLQLALVVNFAKSTLQIRRVVCTT